MLHEVCAEVRDGDKRKEMLNTTHTTYIHIRRITPSHRCIHLPGTRADSVKSGCQQLMLMREWEALLPPDNNGADAMFVWQWGRAPGLAMTS